MLEPHRAPDPGLDRVLEGVRTSAYGTERRYGITLPARRAR
ncbi:hypothetical protein [Streptomyces sp. NPDC012756]